MASLYPKSLPRGSRYPVFDVVGSTNHTLVIYNGLSVSSLGLRSGLNTKLHKKL